MAKWATMSPVLNERGRRLWAAAESVALGYGGDAVVSAATGLARATIRAGRAELAQGVTASSRIRRPGAGRPEIEHTQPGITEALPISRAAWEQGFVAKEEPKAEEPPSAEAPATDALPDAPAAESPVPEAPTE